MNTWLVRTVVAGGLLAQSHVAFGQATVVDLKDFRPREVKSLMIERAITGLWRSARGHLRSRRAE